jgi:hypothetical protein
MAKLIVSPQAALDAAAIVELLSDKAGLMSPRSISAKSMRFSSEYLSFPEAVCAVRHSGVTFDLVLLNRMSLSIAIELTL